MFLDMYIDSAISVNACSKAAWILGKPCKWDQQTWIHDMRKIRVWVVSGE
jgi:hypothetical protein